MLTQGQNTFYLLGYPISMAQKVACFKGWLYGDFQLRQKLQPGQPGWYFSLAFRWNTWKTELAIQRRKFQPDLSYPGWKISYNRTKKFQPRLKKWLTYVRCKLPKRWRLPGKSCLVSLPISVSAWAEIFYAIGTVFQPSLQGWILARVEIFPWNQPLATEARSTHLVHIKHDRSHYWSNCHHHQR